MSAVMSHRYRPGTAVGFVGGGVAALALVPLGDPLVARLAAAVADPAVSADAVLEVLISPGLRAVEHFAVTEQVADGLRAVVRGRFVVDVADQVVAGQGLWSDQVVANTGEFSLRDPEADDSAGELPLTGGVVLAGTLRAEPVQGQPSSPSAAPMGHPVDDRDVVAEHPDEAVGSAEQRESASSAEQRESASSAAVDRADPGVQADRADPDVQADHAGPALGSGQELTDESAGHKAATSAGEPGSESANRIEPDESGSESADRIEPDEPSALPESPGGAPATGHTLPTPFTSPVIPLPAAPPGREPEPAAVSPSEPAPADASSTAAEGRPSFIDSLPWSRESGSTGAAADTAPVPIEVEPEPASDLTVDRDSLRRDSVQTVVAARCPAGHLSPAYAGTCRVCGQPIPPQQPVELPRPTLGVLRLSNGDTVELDRGCILGRNPRVPPGTTGEQPNLVKLMDPDKDISGQHLQVQLEYWHVAVKDLGSTNGTQVVLPGESPVLLRPHDPMMIEPGTKVILAGVFSFVFEATA